MKNKKISFIVKTSIFASLSIILYNFIKFPAKLILPFMPEFLDIQFSNVPVVICGFSCGPLSACIIVIIRTLVKLPFSTTLYVGEVTDMIIGLVYALTTSLIYKKFHTKKGGIVSLLFGMLSWVIASFLLNIFLIVPAYLKIFNIPYNAIVSTLKISGINENNFLLIYGLLIAIPFNLLLSLMVSIITYFIYKRISNFMCFVDNKISNKE